MKKRAIFTMLLAIAASLFAFSQKPKMYADGVYTGESRSVYVQEPFYGQTTVTIKDDKIVTVDFRIIDKQANEVFDSQYEKHYKGNETYIQQCRKDWEGVQAYPKQVVKTNSIAGVDAVSGATWSYNLLKASLGDALGKAKIKK